MSVCFDLQGRFYFPDSISYSSAGLLPDHKRELGKSFNRSRAMLYSSRDLSVIRNASVKLSTTRIARILSPKSRYIGRQMAKRFRAYGASCVEHVIQFAFSPRARTSEQLQCGRRRSRDARYRSDGQQSYSLRWTIPYLLPKCVTACPLSRTSVLSI